MKFQLFIDRLQNQLKYPLPGREAQLRMSSIRRIRELMNESGIENAVSSSVLILFFPINPSSDPGFVLIQRPYYNGVHGGQISLPGGRHEKSDNSLKETALRETQEEIGIDALKIHLIGKISDLYIPPSNYIVAPFVGYTRKKPVFSPDPAEVDQVIEIQLKDLMDEKNIRHKNIEVRSGFSIYAPFFDIGGHTIWGATAMILNELREIVKKIIL